MSHVVATGHHCGRKRSADRRTSPQYAFGAHLSAVCLDEVFDDREAQACASACARTSRIGSVKALEYPWKVGRRNSDARVTDSEPCVTIMVPPCEDCDGSMKRVADRILDQVSDHLTKCRPIRVHPARVVRDTRLRREEGAQPPRSFDRLPPPNGHRQLAREVRCRARLAVLVRVECGRRRMEPLHAAPTLSELPC